MILCVFQDKILSLLGHLSLSPSQRCRTHLTPSPQELVRGRQGKGRQKQFKMENPSTNMFPSFMKCSVSVYITRKQYLTSTLTASKKEALVLFLTDRTQKLLKDKWFTPGLSALPFSVQIPYIHSFHHEQRSKAPGVAMVLLASPSLFPARPHLGWAHE